MMKFTLTLLTICACCAAETANCQDHRKAMDSFRSELWQREFRKEEKKRDETLTSGAFGADEQRKFRSNGFGNDEDASGIGGMELPGQAMLDDLRDETPIAELKIDDVANSEFRSTGETFRKGATAWQLSRSGSDAEAPVATQMSEGPTMTTYLVGFMACIVVCGAMLTGRE